MRCPYFLCNLDVLPATDGVTTCVGDHQYERFTLCPGSGYVTEPTGNEWLEERLMAERAVAAKLPRGVKA